MTKKVLPAILLGFDCMTESGLRAADICVRHQGAAQCSHILHPAYVCSHPHGDSYINDSIKAGALSHRIMNFESLVWQRDGSPGRLADE
ncbi:MAG: hypothetical protein D6791_17855 [Chloroflexi bacterium]|nr:MAG: hypothetical protein D6791_17855 [Chloroflexota bacterium]